MNDISLIWDPTLSAADFEVESNDLVTGNDLQTAVLISWFTDRRAEPGDLIPDSDTRRGWWADAVADVEGDKIGSRLWLLDRANRSQQTLDRAVEYAREAVQWLIDDRVSDRIDVIAEFLGSDGYALQGTFYRPTKDPVTFRFDRTWDSQGEQ